MGLGDRLHPAGVQQPGVEQGEILREGLRPRRAQGAAGPPVRAEGPAYALCGFANIASVGMNVAGYSVLVPERRSEVIGMVWKAMFAGFLATCLSAAVVGLLPRELFH
jgi:hypothetical protein